MYVIGISTVLRLLMEHQKKRITCINTVKASYEEKSLKQEAEKYTVPLLFPALRGGIIFVPFVFLHNTADNNFMVYQMQFLKAV